ncbi:MAG: hypothetical protein GY842_06555 [bacterium]|nr:hypothetical protein [bacterium]
MSGQPQGKVTPLALINDEPVVDLGDDRLGLDTYADTIAAAVLGTAGPFTIGVFGEWGHGKTSLLQLAHTMVDAEKRKNVVTVWFNAWQYEKEEHPVVPLAGTIIRALEQRYARTAKGKLKTAGGSLIRALRAVAYGFSATTKAKVPGFAEVEAGFVAKEMVDRWEELGKHPIDPLLDQSLYYNAFQLLAEVSGKDEAAEKRLRIVVFIDDLDRCLPNNALHLLESIKLVLAQPGFVFVLAIDPRVLEGHLKKRYEEFGLADYPHGQSYLNKIIQLPFSLPTHRGQFKEFIRRTLRRDELKDLAADLEPVQDLIGPACDHNPREVVRFLNRMLVDRHIWTRKQEDPNDVFDAGAFAVARSLQNQCEQAYRTLLGDQGFCDLIAQKKKETRISVRLQRLRSAESRGDDCGDTDTVKYWSKREDDVVAALVGRPHLGDLLETEPGQRWLKERDLRDRIEQFLAAQRPEVGDVDSAKVIEAAIRGVLNKPTGELTEADRTGLQTLDLRGTQIKDVSPLAKLTGLQSLDLSGTPITDVSPLATLAGLQHLDLRRTEITDVSPLANLTGLRHLELGRTQITDASPLADLTGLQYLQLGGTQITDVSPLANLTGLQYLDLRGTQIAYVSPLVTLTKLRWLAFGGTHLTDDQVKALMRSLPEVRVIH